MKTSQEGIDLIKRFEGFRGKAYKALPSEKYYTIGYGHYSADVKFNDIWSQEKAEAVLRKDLEWAEDAVKTIAPTLPQSAFDALVSFTFNCGPANLRSLCRNRDLSQIAEAILLYNKAGGKTLEGLAKRRRAERDLFIRDINMLPDQRENVKKLQILLNEMGENPPLVVDGIIGNKTKNAFFRCMGRMII